MNQMKHSGRSYVVLPSITSLLTWESARCWEHPLNPFSHPQEREAFTKTQCYHYFHSHCLARYAQHMEEEILTQQEEREQHLAPSPKQVLGFDSLHKPS